jgi:ribosomal protein L11 methyltransferase
MALQIDATNAFGTGEHPTTRGCLRLFEAELKRRKHLTRMLDIGCGSGILAMAFAKRTHGQAVAVDLDPVSVMIAAHNRNTNSLRKNVRLAQSNGYRAAVVKQHAPYDIIMANIFARPLSQMAKDLYRHLRPGGIAILAGLLNHQANQVINAHRLQGMELIRWQRDGEWTILALKRSVRA